MVMSQIFFQSFASVQCTAFSIVFKVSIDERLWQVCTEFATSYPCPVQRGYPVVRPVDPFSNLHAVAILGSAVFFC